MRTRRRHYLDYNASAPIRPEAAEAVARALALGGNGSSVHAEGRAARALIDQARDAVAALAGARPEQVVFTSGGTEANGLALADSGRTAVVISAIEHDSVIAAAHAPQIAPVTPSGVVDLAALAEILAGLDRPGLVSVMAANNETGIVQPVAEIAALAHSYRCLFHCDAVQAAGKLPLAFAGWGVDLMSLSAHKLGGPPGIGALVVADTVTLAAQIVGGGQEFGRRAGTENLPGIAGFGAVAALGPEENSRLARLRDRLEALLTRGAPEALIYGCDAPRLANTTCIGLPGMAAETQVIALDLAGVAVSAGAACSSGKVTRSHVLEAMGASETAAGEAIRISLGWHTDDDDIAYAAQAWHAMRARGKRTAA